MVERKPYHFSLKEASSKHNSLISSLFKQEIFNVEQRSPFGIMWNFLERLGMIWNDLEPFPVTKPVTTSRKPVTKILHFGLDL